MVSCGGDTIVNSPNDDGNTDTRHIGSVKGVVAEPRAKNGEVVWEGISRADVQISENNGYSFFAFDKTTYGGWYSIDSLQDNNYTIVAFTPFAHFPDTVGVVVEKQEKVTADTLRLLPKYSGNRILHGTVYDGDGNPARNEEFSIWSGMYFEGRDPCSAEPLQKGRITTFETNNQGRYALQDLRDIYWGRSFFEDSEGTRLRIQDREGDCAILPQEITDEPINTLDLFIPN
ncbi:MAG: hypothetical protein KKB31_00835 [Nanoarchaeota archaeon]|nr:hypothetical protein [Nanoarchaeota archaeon]